MMLHCCSGWSEFEAGFLKFVHEQYPELIEEMNTKKILGDEGEEKFAEAIKRFNDQFGNESEG